MPFEINGLAHARWTIGKAPESSQKNDASGRRQAIRGTFSALGRFRGGAGRAGAECVAFVVIIRQTHHRRIKPQPNRNQTATRFQALTAPFLQGTTTVDITQLLAFSVKNKASDLHLSAGLPPMIRVHGDVRRLNVEPMDHKEVFAMLYDIMNDTQRKVYEENLEVDFSFEIEGLARFRVNAFTQNRGAAGVLRTIPSKILTLEQLNAPKIFGELALKPHSIVLVTGPTGSGKSTARRRTRHRRSRRRQTRGAEKIHHRRDRPRRTGQNRSRHRSRRRNPPRHANPATPQQKQPRPHRRTGRR